jgi:hypothetical protein
MKKIMAIVTIAAVSCVFFLNNSTGSSKVARNSIIACNDYYANDTTPKKRKHKSDTTRRDTTGLAVNHVALNSK